MYLTVSKQQYWLETYGDKEATPVVFLHGFTGSYKTWKETIEMFGGTHWCIAIDLPGHGKSQIDRPIRMETFCDHLAQLLDELAIDKAHFVGYSMGGRTALSFAMLHSERVQSLTLESASPGLESIEEQMARQTKDEALAEEMETQGMAWFVNYWEKIPLFSSQQQLTTVEKRRIKEERLSQTASGLAASLRGMGTGVQPSWWDKLATLTMPVSLIVGEWDKKFVMIAHEMKRHCQPANLHIVSEAGHAIHVEQTEKFATMVKDFITRMEE
ncbi:2-succinyl-6-hydroxy-2,4-cyclohexadiene-1-carboxylate synthase [Paraliobacillus ryukyuensis]|uniref:2-succinyl-6-hydroxy-2, 4-cyclohexadiene-1-carboxylate synthase n=1 Tax=Paraliobacillus ryukyuensis TaxID=200904 RepID=UPI0009A7F657|nr:2-succinyl-6-hydroxy-2,4-cyclohexadiene-1-carboxylate synthase [Paraliobacillus ryukyuensis]